LCKAKH